MDRKYQIFVSSPQQDLKSERDAVVKSILRLGHIPVGMEMFNAADESSWKLITRYIDESDFYVVVLAHRYGSLDGEISFTEKEYDYAVEKSVPTFGFIIDRSAAWPGDRDDDDPVAREKLQKFKAKVDRKHVAYWKNAEELSAQVLACVAAEMPLISRPGWVRGSLVPGPAVADEIARLSEENARLRESSSDDSRFSLIDAMAEDVMCQAVIFMYETGKDIPKHTNYASDRGAGQSLAGFARNSLEAAGITRPAGGDRLTLTDEGKKFAKWLIKKHRKCVFFRTAVGGWGKPDGRYNDSWLAGLNLGPDEQGDDSATL